MKFRGVVAVSERGQPSRVRGEKQDGMLSGVLRLPVVRLGFELVPRRRCRLPAFLGSTLRGGLAGQLRRMCCVRPGRGCAGCSLRPGCAYAVLFDPGPQRLGLKGVERAPRPVVIDPPLRNATLWETRNRLEFDVIIFGRPVRYASYLPEAVAGMAGRGMGRRRHEFGLRQVMVQRGAESWKRIGGDTTASRMRPVELRRLLPAAPAGGRIRMQFVTPLRLLANGRLLVRPTFRDLVRSLLFRANTMLSLYGPGPLEVDFRKLLERAEQVRVARNGLRMMRLQRYSNRQRRALPLDGVVGSIEFEGDGLRSFLPLLRAGTVLHLGKATVMGLGRYELE